ncbi:MAG: hypothetical protein ABIJ34_04255 [archaeon]
MKKCENQVYVNHILKNKQVTVRYKEGLKTRTCSGKLSFFDKSFIQIETKSTIVLLNINHITRISEKKNG